MKITNCRIYRYELPLFMPLQKGLNSRSGLLIQLEEASGTSGWGEIAPLAGFSIETLEQATEEALRIKKDPQYQPTFPSVRCGMELAQEDLESKMAGRLPFAWFTDSLQNTHSFPVTKLLQGSEAEILKSAQTAVRSGFIATKMKVGHLPLIQAIDLVWQVREILGDSIKIRLDANRAWDMEQACRFSQAVSACKIDFIEEPLEKSLTQHRAFYEITGIPVALDETLTTQPITHIFEQKLLPWVKAFVLKPMLLGGFKVCHEIALKAHSLGIETLLSSSYESGIMTQAIGRFAKNLPQATSLGIDPYENLADDLISPRIKIIQGKLSMSSIPYPPKVKMELLKEIT